MDWIIIIGFILILIKLEEMHKCLISCLFEIFEIKKKMGLSDDDDDNLTI